MKSIISKVVMLVALATTIVSFSPSFGGEGFEISLNGKVVMQQFGKDMNTVKNLQLGQLRSTDRLTIRYHHCGHIGKNRVITIRDGQDKTLKVWRYNDSNSPLGEMLCSSQDIITFNKAGNQVLKLYYTSSELPAGRLLANIVAGNNNAVAARK